MRDIDDKILFMIRELPGYHSVEEDGQNWLTASEETLANFAEMCMEYGVKKYIKETREQQAEADRRIHRILKGS